MADFVHLHNHSEFSLLDGLSKIEDMVARVKSLGMKAVAITDHGNMYGTIKFYRTRTDLELLEKYHEGLICLSACVNGFISEPLLKNQDEVARTRAIKLSE